MLPTRSQRLERRALTLVELLISLAIVGLISVSLGALGTALHRANSFGEQQTTAVQHARVCLQRIERSVRNATVTTEFPGCLVVSDRVSSWSFPETLVVWRPETPIASPAGLPLVRDLLIYTLDPDRPNELIELRAPNDGRTVPEVTETANWRALIRQLKTASSSEIRTLTSLVRISSTSPGTGPVAIDAPATRGCVRFHVRVRPDAMEWTDYVDGNRTWDSLPWPLDLYGPSSGVRHVSCEIELQLQPESWTGPPMAFFGSASVSYPLDASSVVASP